MCYFFQILESIADNIEEIEEEYLVLRDLSKHPNIPDFAGLFLKRGTTVEDDQLWFVLEVSQRVWGNFFSPARRPLLFS